MLRSVVLAAVIASALVPPDSASAQTSPPLCAQGSWAMRTKDGWTCSKAMTPPDNPAPSGDNTQTPRGHGHRGGGGPGGMPQ